MVSQKASKGLRESLICLRQWGKQEEYEKRQVLAESATLYIRLVQHHFGI